MLCNISYPLTGASVKGLLMTFTSSSSAQNVKANQCI